MQKNMKPQVALGLGNNVDYEIAWDTAVLENLCREYQITPEDVHDYPQVSNEREVVCSILYHVSTGSGKEIYITDSEVVEKFSQRFPRRITMGGTAIRAALAMDRMGAPSVLHLVTINDHVREQVPAACSYVCSNDRDTSYPHLIIQFKGNLRIQTDKLDICSPRENRIIYTNDPDNTIVRLTERYTELIGDAKIFLISGFNVMLDKDMLDDRIDTLLRIMQALPEDAVVFSESGCYFDPAMQWHVLDRLRDHIDIYSMNEEEMQLALGRKVNVLDAAEMEAALAELHAKIGTKNVVVHAHCWALIYGENAPKFKEAIVSASTMATTRYRFGDFFTKEQFASTREIFVPEERLAFIQDLDNRLGDRVCCTPVGLVSETEVTTIGLGDSFVGGFMLPFA